MMRIILFLTLSFFSWSKDYPDPDPADVSLKEDLEAAAPETTMVNALNPKSDIVSFMKKEDLRLYLNSDNNYASVFREPGLTYRNCSENPNLCMAWPDAKTEIYRLPDKDIKRVLVTSDRKGTEEYRDYVYVKIKYTRNGKIKDDEGWMDASLLKTEPQTKSLYLPPQDPSATKQEITSDKECPPKTPLPMNPPSKKNMNDLKNLAKAPEKPAVEDSKVKIAKSADALKNMIGQCPINPPHKKEQAYLNKWNKKNIYDEEVMPVLAQMKNKIPNLPKEDPNNCSKDKSMVSHKKMDWADLVNIDALSRTIYSEMNECFDVGLEYPMAAARVAMNRAKDIDKKEGNWQVFLKSWWHKEEKPTLAKALTADRQFSVWNYASGPKDKTILMALCPTRDLADAKNWKGGRPNKRDLSIWNQAMQIATDAVLYSCSFKAKTDEVKQRYYTSKMNGFYNYKKASAPPKIDGRKVDSFRCMYLWEGR